MERDVALTALREVAVEVLSVEPDVVTEEARFKEDLDDGTGGRFVEQRLLQSALGVSLTSTFRFLASCFSPPESVVMILSLRARKASMFRSNCSRSVGANPGRNAWA
jgi:hypothetical protein